MNNNHINSNANSPEIIEPSEKSTSNSGFFAKLFQGKNKWRTLAVCGALLIVGLLLIVLGGGAKGSPEDMIIEKYERLEQIPNSGVFGFEILEVELLEDSNKLSSAETLFYRNKHVTHTLELADVQDYYVVRVLIIRSEDGESYYSMSYLFAETKDGYTLITDNYYY